jgi:SAM-dependent methyltransferase
VCNATDASQIHHMDFELASTSPLPRQYQIVACRKCGMVFADSPAAQSDYDSYYAQFSKYEDVKTASGGGYSDADRERLEATANLISSYLELSDSIVDIGCANGGMLDALSQLGHKSLHGIDPSPTSISHIQGRGFIGYTVTISELKHEDVGRYQAVILSHVLEHLFDLRSAMQTISSLLLDDGVAYIEVPDALRYLSNYVVPFYYFDAEHINHFDHSALENLARLHCFDVVAAGQKEIPVSASVNYPAIYAVLRKQPMHLPLKVRNNGSVATMIKEYVEKSRSDSRLDKLDTFASSQEPLIVWGAGSYTQRLLTSTSLGQCNIVAIVDNDHNKHDLEILGVRVVGTEALDQIEGTIVVAAAVGSDEIKREIVTMGLRHRVVLLS